MLQKDNLVGSMKGKFRRERSWREAGSRLRVEKITEVRDDGGLGQSGTGGEPAGDGFERRLAVSHNTFKASSLTLHLHVEFFKSCSGSQHFRLLALPPETLVLT